MSTKTFSRTWALLAADSVLQFLAQPIDGYGLEVLFQEAAPSAADDGPIVAVDETISRAHGDGSVWARAAAAPPGFPSIRVTVRYSFTDTSV